MNGLSQTARYLRSLGGAAWGSRRVIAALSGTGLELLALRYIWTPRPPGLARPPGRAVEGANGVLVLSVTVRRP